MVCLTDVLLSSLNLTFAQVIDCVFFLFIFFFSSLATLELGRSILKEMLHLVAPSELFQVVCFAHIQFYRLHSFFPQSSFFSSQASYDLNGEGPISKKKLHSVALHVSELFQLLSNLNLFDNVIP